MVNGKLGTQSIQFPGYMLSEIQHQHIPPFPQPPTPSITLPTEICVLPIVRTETTLPKSLMKTSLLFLSHHCVLLTCSLDFMTTLLIFQVFLTVSSLSPLQALLSWPPTESSFDYTSGTPSLDWIVPFTLRFQPRPNGNHTLVISSSDYINRILTRLSVLLVLSLSKP